MLKRKMLMCFIIIVSILMQPVISKADEEVINKDIASDKQIEESISESLIDEEEKSTEPCEEYYDEKNDITIEELQRPEEYNYENQEYSNEQVDELVDDNEINIQYYESSNDDELLEDDSCKVEEIHGWYTELENQYYYDEEGNRAYGLKSIDGDTYYFDNESGVLIKGQFIAIDGKLYYFGSASGKLQKTGWYKNTYYFDKATGEVAVGLKIIDGNTYYFNENGVIQKGKMVAENSKTYYTDKTSGIIVKGQFITIGGKIYYFGATSGELQKTGWYTKNNAKYYLDTNTGVVAVGLKTISGKGYYFNAKGVMQKGKYVVVDGDMYYFHSDGHMAKGEFITIDGILRYFGAASGKLQKSGWYTKNGVKYYLDKQTGEVYTGTRTIDGKTYSFDSKGKFLGETKRIGLVDVDGKTYYFDNNGDSVKGKIVTVDNGSYYFNAMTGVMVKGAFVKVNGKIYYFGAASGKMQKTGWYSNYGGKYYFDKATGEVYIGKKEINGSTYYFDNSGQLIPNYIEPGMQEIDGKIYYLDKNGNYVKGKILNINGKLYYFGASSGALQKTGWYVKGNKIYYFDKTTGEAYTGQHYMDGKYYYFNKDGVLEGAKIYTENEVITKKISGKTYTINGINTGIFIERNGETYYEGIYNPKGWVNLFGDTYYFDKTTGAMSKNFSMIDGKTYYFNDNGILQTGLKEIDGKLYFFDTKTGALVKGQFATFDISYELYGVEEDEYVKTYYLGASSGSIQKTGWYTKNGNTYYLDQITGEVYTGIKSVEGNMYWFNTDGSLLGLYGTSDNIFNEDDGTYYMNKIGECVKGEFVFVKDGIYNHIYYFGASSGKMQKTGWYMKNGNSYYFDKITGDLYTGVKTVDNKQYYFNDIGIMQKNQFLTIGNLNDGTESTYYFDSKTGELRFGWIELNNKIYYSDNTGALFIGINTIEDKKFLFKDDFTLTKGWYEKYNEDGTYTLYYADENTGELANGLTLIGNNTYYFDENGVLQKNIEFSLNGIGYITDSNGVVSVVQTVSNEPYRYYYYQLDDKAKILYDEIVDHLDAIKSGVDSIILSNKVNEYAQAHGIDSFFDGTMQNAVDAFNLDYADVFYWDCTKTGLSCSGYTHYFKAYNGASNFLEDEFNSAAKVEIACNKVDTKINQIMSSISSDSTDYEIVATVHDWLVDNLDYDHTFSTNCHNVYGTLVEFKPVCEGYARTFKTLMDKYDIACIMVTGTGVNSTGSDAHAWNYVQLDGEWYAMDVTWDDPTIGGSGTPSQELLNQIHHSYFLKGANDTNFMNSHILDNDFEVPTLNGGDYVGAA